MGAEVVPPRPFEKLRRQDERAVLVAADVRAAVDEIAGLTGSHLSLLERVAGQERVEKAGFIPKVAGLHVLPEYAPIGLGAGRLSGEAVAEPPEEGLLREVGGVQIAGEDQKLLERNLNLLAGV